MRVEQSLIVIANRECSLLSKVIVRNLGIHIIVPVQFSHCLVVSNGAPVRLTRVNLMQTLLSFDGKIDARIEFRFGLFADNSCRLRDGLDNRALGL